MASEKQLNKWYNEAVKLNSNPAYAEAYARYRQLAKRADQRLTSLEALSHNKHFHGVREYAYAGAIRDIESWGGSRRFNTKPPTNLNQLEAKIADIEKFLSKPTSTKSGIVATYKKRADTITARYGKEFGVKFTWQDIANYYEKKKAEIEGMKMGSKTEVRVLAVVKKLGNVKDIDKVKTEVERITGKDKILARQVERLIEQGLDYSKLMGGN